MRWERQQQLPDRTIAKRGWTDGGVEVDRTKDACTTPAIRSVLAANAFLTSQPERIPACAAQLLKRKARRGQVVNCPTCPNRIARDGRIAPLCKERLDREQGCIATYLAAP